MKALSGKPKKCKVCKKEYVPAKTMQATCFDFGCAIEYGVKLKQKSYKAETRAMKAKLNDESRAYWIAKAQKSFNAYIRERDRDLPCVSCGRYHEGQWHAGHYRTVGACGALRFCEKQVWKQCSACNNYLSGNIAAYRAQLIIRVGNDCLAKIENYSEIKRWTIPELKEITERYKVKLNCIKV